MDLMPRAYFRGFPHIDPGTSLSKNPSRSADFDRRPLRELIGYMTSDLVSVGRFWSEFLRA
jgi:hypothetical protein